MNTADSEEVGLRDIPAAAKFLGVKPTWLRDAVTAQKVPCTRIGKHVRFSQDHLDAIIRAGEQPVLGVPTRGEVTERRTRGSARKAPPRQTKAPSRAQNKSVEAAA